MTCGSESDRVLDQIAGLYSGSLAEHGAGPRGVGWPDAASHRLRFDQLASIVGDEPSVSVADLGCGYGALYEYLEERLGERLRAYVGYEISPGMATAARSRLRDPRARVVESGDPSVPVDYSFACGPFNVRLDVPEPDWDAHVKSRLKALAGTSRAGIAFNLLTTEVDWRDPKLFYADPDEYVAFCRSELSDEVELLSGYGLFEWTIHVRLGR